MLSLLNDSNIGSNFFFISKIERYWSIEDVTKLLKVFKENSDGNWAEIFKHFPDKQEEEVIFNFLKLPYTHFLNLADVVQESHLEKIKYGEFGISDTGANISNGVNGKV